MRHFAYKDACQTTEHRDMPVQLRNRRTGEIGTVIQCLPGEMPEAFLVDVGYEVTTWDPEEVEEVTRLN